ncbi:MAG: hypothetical protein K5668_11265 [Lachnospiraceae bacterium]|nr:hypothetical protein [Lachnospiraceae bacterium]
MDNLGGLSPEQQALFASIMGNSSQVAAQNPVIPAMPEAAPVTPAPAPAPAAPAGGGDDGRVLSQAEIDALIASMAN